MLLKDVLFSQGFGTRYDCAAMVASGAVEIAAEVHDDPDEDVETEGLVFRCLGTDWPYFEKAIIALNKPAGYECSMKPSAHPSVMTLLPSPLRRRNMQPVGRPPAEQLRPAAEHHAAHLRAGILQREITMAGIVAAKSRDFAGDPQDRKTAFQQHARAAVQLGDRNDIRCT